MKQQTISMAFSHVGLYVFELEKMAEFYQRILGLRVTDRGTLPGRELVFLSADINEHHQVVLATGRTGNPGDKVVNQISFRLQSLEDLQSVYQSLKEDGEATDFRAINHGNAWTLYFRDPEQNRIELFVDSPWYVAQPRADDLDLRLPTADIYQFTEEMCKQDPSFMTRTEWQASFKKRFTLD
ncbi:VOC family protein [Advenella kashmirensis]